MLTIIDLKVNMTLLLDEETEVQDFDLPLDLHKYDIPGNDVRFANIRPEIILENGEAFEKASGLELLVYGASDEIIGKIILKNLKGAFKVSHAIEMIAMADVEKHLCPNDCTYNAISSNYIGKIVKLTTQNAGNVISKLGRNPKKIMKNYERICKVEPDRPDQVKELRINKETLKINEISSQNIDNEISWIDISTQHANRLDNPESFQRYLLKNHLAHFSRENSEEFIILNFRLLEPGNSDCEVKRSKIMILIDGDKIITLHDGELSFLKKLQNEIKEGKLKKPTDYKNEVGTGFIFSTIIEKLCKINEETLRQLEGTAINILSELSNSRPTELHELLKDIEKINISSDYFLMKSNDAKEQFNYLCKAIEETELKKITGSLLKHFLKSKINYFSELLSGIIDRGKVLVKRTEKLAESHNVHINMHMDVINSKLAILGAILGPSIACATLAEIAPNLVSTPALLGIMIGGILSSILLLGIAKAKKLF